MANKKINTNTNITGSISVTKKEVKKNKKHYGFVTAKIFVILTMVGILLFKYWEFSIFLFDKQAEPLKTQINIFIELLNSNFTYIILTGIVFLVWRAYK